MKQGNKTMQQIFGIVKKYRFLIFGGLGVVIFLTILDPAIEFVLKISEHAKKPVIYTEPRWQRFTNRQCEYVVSFPSPPFTYFSPFTNNPHIVLFRQFVAVLSSNQAFMVTTLQTSFTNDFSKKQINLMLDKAMAGGMGKEDTLIYKRDITYGTNAGREFEFQKTNKNYLKARYYRMDNYLQMLIVTMPPENKDSTNILYFFNSFSPIQR